MDIRVGAAVALVGAFALVAGCGPKGGDASGTPTGGVGTTASPSTPVGRPTTPPGPKPSSSHPAPSTPPTHTPTRHPSSPPASTKPAPPTSTPSKLTLTGTATTGAEPGCVGLRTGQGRYELTGDAARKLSGQRGTEQDLGRVRVVGHLAPKTMMSHCMMGRILVVKKLTRL